MSFDDVDDTTEAHERRIVRCRERECNAKIIFLDTESGMKMPCDADTVDAIDTLFDAKKHTSHFATCKKPSAFRRRER